MNENQELDNNLTEPVSSSRVYLGDQPPVGSEPAASPADAQSMPSNHGGAAASADNKQISGRSLWQILIVLVVLLVLVNIPFNDLGAGLAHLSPKTTAVVLYDGVLVQGSGPEIYVLDHHKLRWISSEEAFQQYFKFRKVRHVSDGLLEQFERGEPIRRLLMCRKSRDVYALENGKKRWVEDPFSSGSARRWDGAQMVSCTYLQRLAPGSPISAAARSQP